MRWARSGWWLVMVLLLAGCFDVEARFTVNQDGSGTMRQVVDLPSNLAELTLTQGGFRNPEEFVADAVINAENSLAGFGGITILDAAAQWVGNDPERKLRVSTLFAFDSIEQWNKWAEAKRNFLLKLDSTTGSGGERRWTVGVVTPKIEAPVGAPAGEPGDQPAPPMPQIDFGKVNIFVVGPGPAPQTDFANQNEEVEAVRLADGSVRFSGSFMLLTVPRTFEGRFVGRPLSAEQLAELRRQQRVEPSESYRRVLAIVERKREIERTQQAAREAIAHTRFELRLQMVDERRVQLSYTRTYYGQTAAYFADREAMMHAMLPELGANYETKIEKVTGPEQMPGLAVTRTRRRTLELEELGSLVTVKRDGPDLVYLVSVPALLAGIDLADDAPPQLGRVVFETQWPITGTNGTAAGPNRAELELTPALLRANAALVVRCAAR